MRGAVRIDCLLLVEIILENLSDVFCRPLHLALLPRLNSSRRDTKLPRKLCTSQPVAFSGRANAFAERDRVGIRVVAKESGDSGHKASAWRILPAFPPPVGPGSRSELSGRTLEFEVLIKDTASAQNEGTLRSEVQRIMTTYLRKAAATSLVCMTLLTQTVSPQLRGHVRSQRSGQLYKVVNNDNRVGFIDKTGKLVIGFDRLPKETAFVRDFHEGRAVIYVKKEAGNATGSDTAYRVGYIDETGKVIIPERFNEAYDFSEGLAYVRSESVNAFISRQGRVAIRLNEKTWPSLETFGYGFQGGFAAVSVNTEVGFIDHTGKLLCKGYTSAARFSEGLAAVVVGRGRQAKYGFINAKGRLVIAPRFDPVLSRHEQIDSLSRFAEGFASVKMGNMYGYIDKKGNFVIPPQFSFAGDFSAGLAFVKLQGKAGYIDKSGHWVITPEEVILSGGRFNEGLAPVSFTSGWGYIDRTGKTVIKARFFQAYEFVGGVAAVDLLMDSGPRYIDKTGKYLWRPE